MSEQSAARLRRRVDARSFDLACEAAVRIGARRLRSIAYERAIEGTIKRHYYHGELKSEERVFDNRLLAYLLGKLDKLIEPAPEAEAVAANWQPWMEAIEHGLPAPPLPGEAEEPEESCEEEDEREDEFAGMEAWEDEDGTWWIGFPPPDDFDGEEEGEPADPDYRRTLTPAEQAVIEAAVAEDREALLERGRIQRDLYFGFEPGVSSPREVELTELSKPRAALADAFHLGVSTPMEAPDD